MTFPMAADSVAPDFLSNDALGILDALGLG